jgi:hypothetical protein
MRVCVLLSLSQRYCLIIIGEIQLLNKYLSSFSLFLQCALAGSVQKIWSQKLPKFTSDLSHLRPKAIDCLSINPPFFRKSASNLNQNILLLCISYITEEISDKGRGQKMSTRHLDYDPDRRARESGREEAEVLDARRLVYVEPWYRKLWRWIHFF